MIRNFVTSVLFALLFFMMQVHVDASVGMQIVAKSDDVIIYDNRDGQLTVLGNMVKNEPLLIDKEYGSNWWQVRFANAYGYIKKTDVITQPIAKKVVWNKQQHTNTTILIHNDTEIYDNSTGRLVKFATVKGDFRYPILADFGNFWKVDAGGRVGYIAKKASSIDKGVTVLMYHHILTPAEKADSPFAKASTTITTTEFNEQMDYLKKNGYSTITTKDLEGYLDGKVNLPAQTVVITIDDGNISSRIYAYPKLKELGFKADQFIITSRISKTASLFEHKKLKFLSVQEMDAMQDVYNYHAHTHNLHNLTAAGKSHLVAKDKNFVTKDLLTNRKLLNNTTYIAYPFGQYNNETLVTMKETGFTMAYLIKAGRTTLGSNKLLLPRSGIEPNTSVAQFARIVHTGMPAKLNNKPAPSPKPEPKPPLKEGEFKDVTQGHDKYEAIMSLSNRKIINGYPDRTFRPNNTLTRGQAAKILVNTLGLTTT